MTSARIKFIPAILLCVILLRNAPAYSADAPPTDDKLAAAQRAVDNIINLANKGDAEAQFKLASLYYVRKDYEKASNWLRRSAQQGHAEAQYNLAFAYNEGEGVEKDHREAIQWFQKAGDQGMAKAQHSLGMLYFMEPDVRDYKQALKWFQKAADQGLDKSQHILGLMYEDGAGVAKDYKRAVKWQRKAALQGDARAQYALGKMYATGQGVVQNYVEAYKWNYLAVLQKYPKAISELETFNELLTPQQIAKAREQSPKLLNPPQALPAKH